MKIAGLCRVSTEGQARKGESLAEQHRFIESAAAMLGHKVVKWYEGQEHATPQQERLIFEQMLGDAASDRWDAVMVVDVSRWSRSNEDSKRGVRILNQHRKRFFASTQEVPIMTALGRQLLGLQIEMHEGTAGHLVERSLATKIARMATGRPSIGSRPYARRWDASAGWQTDKEEEKTFRRAVAMVHKRHSLQRIANTLGGTAQTWLYRFRHCGGSRVVRAKNELGDVREFKQTFPALLTDKEQSALLQRLTANKMCGRGTRADGTPTRHYLLRGKIRCAGCGQTLCGMPDSRNPKVYRYAHKTIIEPDNSKRPSLPQCVRTIRGPETEWRVFASLTRLLQDKKELDKSLAAALDSSGRQRETLEAEVASLRRENTALEKALHRELDLLAGHGSKTGPTVQKHIRQRLQEFEDRMTANQQQTEDATRQLAAFSVRSEQVAQVQQGVDFLVAKGGWDANHWSEAAKAALLEAWFGAGSLRRDKELGIYVKRGGSIDRISGRFVLTEGLAEAAQEGYTRPRLKPRSLRASKLHGTI